MKNHTRPSNRQKPSWVALGILTAGLTNFVLPAPIAQAGGSAAIPTKTHAENRASLYRNGRKNIRAQRVKHGSIKVDGYLSETEWLNANFVADFLQKEPSEGSNPTNRVSVAILYDDEAMYFGARMVSSEPENLRMHLDRRDTQGPAEQFIVSLDTYLNRRTAYVFGVNTAGVRFDRFHPEDSEGNRDYSYNPVWEARTSRFDQGWIAEMRIPFSQLRFNDLDEMVWGVNFNRWIPAQNEDVFWIYVPRDETGYASHFGDLVGISEIKPSRRLEIMPYAAGDGKFIGEVNKSDPFSESADLHSRLGVDLKMGLGPNMTVEATVNPDFGQVEADPAEVNLSAFETFFSERRSFFTEGSQLFDSEGPDFFYSRRIGAAPHGGAEGDFISRPGNTSILAASKITGRLSSGLSIGVLGAVTQREFANSYFSDGDSSTVTRIEPRTFFGVTRLQQEFGSDGTTAGIILTGVHRDFEDSDPLASQLRQNAVSGAADWQLRFEGGKYDIIGAVGFSHVQGDTSIIRKTQESSARYFQRPDADYVSVDPTRTSLTGYSFNLRGGKRGGKHWLWGGGGSIETPDFELNDAGILGSADDMDVWNHLTYRETQPGRIFRNYTTSINSWAGWNLGGVNTYSGVEIFGEGQFKNYWSAWLWISREFRGTNDSRTRGGPTVGQESGWTWFGGLDNNFSATTRVGANGEYSIDELNGWLYNASVYVNTRVGNKLSLSVQPSYSREDQPRQYVTTLADPAGGALTYGSRYVFSRIDRSQISMQIRANYFFTPDLSLEVYAEPFSASGRYYDHGQVVIPGSMDLTNTGTDGSLIVTNADGTFSVVGDSSVINTDRSNFSSLSFRSNVVLRWEFMPGSVLFAVWQRNLASEKTPGANVRARQLWDSVSGEGEDFLALKISYWMPIS